jgi:UDP-N-acetylglucosamine acyltransferase
MTAETFIHPMACVEDGAQLGVGVRIGPFCHVQTGTELGDGVELISHVSVMNGTSLGGGSKIFPQVVLGAAPQNKAHKGSRTTLTIGKNCEIREGTTMHAGSDSSRGKTTVGDNCYFMAYSHVAHDCAIGNNVTAANGVGIAGHVDVGDNVIFGGLSAVHQFVRIGDNAFIGGFSFVTGDVIPFAIAAGNPAKLRGLNVVGLRRAGLSKTQLHELRQAYKMIFDGEQPVSENIERAREQYSHSPQVTKILDFISNRAKRHYAVPPVGGRMEDEEQDVPA